MPTPKTMGAGAFKAKCLSVMDDVHNGRGEIVVTRRGKPLVKIVPLAPEKKESIFGFLKGRAKIVGDIMEPTMSDEDVAEWERQWDDLTRWSCSTPTSRSGWLSVQGDCRDPRAAPSRGTSLMAWR
jgi:prevent-host-death family protein